jgi:hypothetical protein
MIKVINALPSPKLRYVKNLTYASIRMVLVCPAKPVNEIISSNRLIPTKEVKVNTMAIVGRSIGKVINRKDDTELHPSICALSNNSLGIARRAASMIIDARGTVLHITTNEAIDKTKYGLDNH